MVGVGRCVQKTLRGNARPAHDVLQHGPSPVYTTQARRDSRAEQEPPRFTASLFLFLVMKNAPLQEATALPMPPARRALGD
jgi:hypothetical protein